MVVSTFSSAGTSRTSHVTENRDVTRKVRPTGEPGDEGGAP